MGPTRRTRARKALMLALFLLPFELLAFASTVGVASNPLSFLLNVVIVLATGFPFFYFVLALDEKIRRWWRARHPMPIVRGLGSVESFRWTGRPARANIRQVVAVFLVFGVMATVAVLLPMREDMASFVPLSVLGLVLVAFIGLFALGTGLMARRITIEVDGQGVRTQGMFRGNFTLQWPDVARIEFVPMEKMQPFAVLMDVSPSVPPMRMYVLMGPDGTVIGGILPHGMLGRDLGNRLEAALLTQASRCGIPVVEVRWRDSMHWKRRKVSRRRADRTT